jgi:hypothetical protein
MIKSFTQSSARFAIYLIFHRFLYVFFKCRQLDLHDYALQDYITIKCDVALKCIVMQIKVCTFMHPHPPLRQNTERCVTTFVVRLQNCITQCSSIVRKVMEANPGSFSLFSFIFLRLVIDLLIAVVKSELLHLACLVSFGDEERGRR